MLRIPGSDVEVELLEYKGCERHSGSARPCDYGTGHFALFVERHRGALRRPRRARRRVPLRRPGRDDAARPRRQEPLLARPRRLRRSSSASGRRSDARVTSERLAQYRLDAPDPALRGPRRRALPRGRDRRHRAQLRRPGGDRRRRRERDARDGLPRRAPPLARAPDRGRRRPAPDDGRDVRQAHRLLQGARRLDAHRRPLARHPRLQRDRRRRDPARVRRRADREAPRHRPGRGRVLRRRRRRPGRGARGDEPRGDLEAAGRLHLREQPVRALGRLADAARRRGHRRPRRRLRDAGRGRRRQRRRGRRGGRRARARARARRATGRRCSR